jgi:hypothetical protein
MGLRHVIFKNFWLKLVALALAIMIWFTISYGIDNDFKLVQPRLNRVISQEFLRLPVSIITQPGDARVFSIGPKEVVITAVGEEAVMRKLPKQSIKVYIDLTDFHSRQATNGELRAYAPNGVTVIKINPSVVNVEQISP